MRYVWLLALCLIGCQPNPPAPIAETLEDRYEKLRLMGYPLDEADYIARFRPPGETNAYSKYAPTLVQRYRSNAWMAARISDPAHKEAISTLTEIAKFDRLYSEPPLPRSDNAEEYMVSIAMTSGLFRLRAEFGQALRVGDYDRSGALINLISKVEQLGRDVVIDGGAPFPFPDEPLYALLEMLRVRREWAPRVLRLLPRPSRTSWHDVRSKRAFQTFALLRNYPRDGSNWQSSGLPMRPELREIAALYIEYFEFAHEGKWDEAKRVDQQAARLLGRDGWMVRPGLGAYSYAELQYREAMGLIDASVKLEKYFNENEFYPIDLSSLEIKEAYAERLRYQRTDVGYRLWALGSDGIDQGGVPREKVSPHARGRFAYDIVFERK